MREGRTGKIECCCTQANRHDRNPDRPLAKNPAEFPDLPDFVRFGRLFRPLAGAAINACGARGCDDPSTDGRGKRGGDENLGSTAATAVARRPRRLRPLASRPACASAWPGAPPSASRWDWLPVGRATRRSSGGVIFVRSTPSRSRIVGVTSARRAGPHDLLVVRAQEDIGGELVALAVHVEAVVGRHVDECLLVDAQLA